MFSTKGRFLSNGESCITKLCRIMNFLAATRGGHFEVEGLQSAVFMNPHQEAEDQASCVRVPSARNGALWTVESNFLFWETLLNQLCLG